MRKQILVLVFLCIIAGGIPMAMAEYPAMNGTWKSTDGSLYLLNDVIEKLTASENTWVIDAQNDHIVSGHKTFSMPDGLKANQTLVGIFNPDKKTLSFIDQPGGWAEGTLTDADTLFIAMMNPGTVNTTLALTMTLHRQK